MISFEEAFALIAEAARPLGSELVSLEQAAGRVLAEPVLAAIDGPRADLSMMDGYALRDAELVAGVSLKVVGEAFPGDGFAARVEPGTCVRIFTGAPLPTGADRVVMQEIASRSGDEVRIEQSPGADAFVRRYASDFAVGDCLVGAGTKLGPRQLIAIASGDVGIVQVFRQPKLAILATGNELRWPGEARKSVSANPESLTLGLAAFTTQWGGHTILRRTLPDDLDWMQGAVGDVLSHSDVVVVTGGASVGERDFAQRMFDQVGLELIFSKVAIKPGKPVWFGTIGQRLVLGLPGNPTSAFVTARLLLAPLLAGLCGLPVNDAVSWRTMPLKAAIDRNGNREAFLRARDVDGAAHVLANQDSGAQRALANADLVVRRAPDAAPLGIGDAVEVLAL